MESGSSDELPLVVIVGPTASGKTALSIQLAEKYKGEIICADSRTVYKELDIGTAKPTNAERAQVPHWGLDLVAPGQRFTAADFKVYAQDKIKEIRSRGQIPFLVGGTGLYVDAVVLDYRFGPDMDSRFRKMLDSQTIAQLQEYCIKNNILLPENVTNKRYLIRAIEQKSVNTMRRKAPVDNVIVVGIATDRGVLRERISRRIEQLFKDDVVKEATILSKKYGWESEAMTGNIYPLIHHYLKKEVSLEELKDKATTLDWRLAKRQLTWLRRNSYVKWLSLEDASHYLSQLLAKYR